MSPRIYSDEILNEAATLCEAGVKTADISKKLGISIGSVYWHCLRLGADNPNNRNKISPALTKPFVVKRGNHTVSKFTIDEDSKLLELEATGMRICDISRAMSRPPNSLRGRLMTLARQQSRREGEL